LHVDDAARAVLMVCDQHATLAPREIFNVGASDQNFQKKTLGEMIQKRLPQSEVVYNHKAVDKRSYKVNFGKIQQHLGFTAIHSPGMSIDQICSGLESGLVSTAELDESVNVGKNDLVRNDTTPHVHVARSKL